MNFEYHRGLCGVKAASSDEDWDEDLQRGKEQHLKHNEMLPVNMDME